MTAPDPTFPTLHIRPATGWINDPNGVSRIDGTYHVFYQLNPNSPTHGDIHWGHHSSPDLFTWREEPIALRPRPGAIDAAGCWSGSMVDDHGVPTAVYSAIPDTAQNAQVVLARSDRTLIDWVQDEVSQMAPPTDPGVADVRDPFVFTVEDRRFAVQGAGHQEGHPRILLYSCDDLTDWTALGTLLTDDDPIAGAIAPARIWECPNLVRVEGRWVLLVSQWQWVDGAHLLAGVRYLIGDLELTADLEAGGDSLTFRPTAGGSVDDGPVFYAPQCLQEDDRVLLWGWAWELDRTDAQIEAAGWAGVLTFPRELYLDGDVLGSRPAAELTALRGRTIDVTDRGTIDASAFEIEAAAPVRLLLVDGDVRTEVASTTTAGARVLVDGSLVEIHDGPVARTTRAYPTATSRWEMEQTVAAGAATVWELSL